MSPLDSVDGVTEAAAAASSPQWVLRVEFETAKLHHLRSTLPSCLFLEIEILASFSATLCLLEQEEKIYLTNCFDIKLTDCAALI